VAVSLLSAGCSSQVSLRGQPPRIGCIYRDDVKITMTNATLTASGPGVQESGSADVVIEAAYEEQVLAVVGGEITKSRLKVISEVLAVKAMVQGQSETHHDGSPLQAETIQFEKIGDEWKRTFIGRDGKAPTPAQLEDLKYFPPPQSMAELYPAEPVSPGYQWTVDAKKLQRIFRASKQIDSGRWKMTFQKTIKKDGKSYAQIAEDIDMQGTFRDDRSGLHFDMRTTGTSYLPLQPGGVETVQAQGTLKVTGIDMEDGRPIQMTINGPMTLDAKSSRTEQ
jgi:hypothetical protein